MNAALKNLLRLLCASAAITVSAAALNFVVDPLQLFRPARLFAAGYSLDNRMQNAGLIRSQQYDTVFMGTSLGQLIAGRIAGEFDANNLAAMRRAIDSGGDSLAIR